MIERKGGLSQRLIQVGQRHAPRFAHSGIAARQRHRPEMPGTPEAVIPPDQEFAPPDRAVAAVAGAVEDDADHVAVQAVFCHAGGQVGMVVLHRDQRQPGSCGIDGTRDNRGADRRRPVSGVISSSPGQMRDGMTE